MRGALIAVWPLTCVDLIVVQFLAPSIMAEGRFCNLLKGCHTRDRSDVPGCAYLYYACTRPNTPPYLDGLIYSY
jgi:hypothetical protein